MSDGRGRFRAVVAVGAVCAALLGAVVVGLTGSAALGVVVALVVAAVLVGLGVVGVRQGQARPAALAAHEARQRRLRAVVEGAGGEAGRVDGTGAEHPRPDRPGGAP